MHVPVISVIGTSGVGKSFLVKQLASFNSAPAFFEGEMGVFPDWILKSVTTGNDPVKRWQWFMDRYRLALERARTISDNGLLCFVDGAIISAEAIKEYEPPELHDDLQKMIDACIHCKSDLTLLLVANEDYLKKSIEARRRDDEQNAIILQRATKIQDAFKKVTKSKKNVMFIDRSNLDFTKNDDLEQVNQQIEELLR